MVLIGSCRLQGYALLWRVACASHARMPCSHVAMQPCHRDQTARFVMVAMQRYMLAEGEGGEGGRVAAPLGI
jgi:hypothetical protein